MMSSASPHPTSVPSGARSSASGRSTARGTGTRAVSPTTARTNSRSRRLIAPLRHERVHGHDHMGHADGQAEEAAAQQAEGFDLQPLVELVSAVGSEPQGHG